MTYEAKELKFFKTVRGSVPLAIKTKLLIFTFRNYSER